MEKSDSSKVVKKLIELGMTISTMESCTSGLIASMITDTEGASAIFPGGYVTYSNESKVMAGLDEKVIEQYGVYSRECSIAMAETVREKFKTDIAIGITGTTGNVDPNNHDSIQGKAFFTIIIRKDTYSYEINEDVSDRSRHQIKQMYADRVFEELIKLL